MVCRTRNSLLVLFCFPVVFPCCLALVSLCPLWLPSNKSVTLSLPLSDLSLPACGVTTNSMYLPLSHCFMQVVVYPPLVRVSVVCPSTRTTCTVYPPPPSEQIILGGADESSENHPRMLQAHK
ncbi:unnamed protein product [Ectocarpus sp. 4 AP-2014]